MLYVKNKQGREIELSVCGSYSDDIEISEAYYLDDCDAEVSETDLEYIYNKYSDELYEEWLEFNIGMSDNYFELMKEGN